MILATAQVSVTSSGVLIAAERQNRGKVVLVNHGTTDVFVGGIGVTASTGALLAGAKGQTLTIEAGPTAVYAIVASTSQTISVIETG